MIRIARERSRKLPNVEFAEGDVRTMDLGSERFDCIVTIATLHHLPVQETVPALTKSLKPGGRLLVLDLYRAEGLVDLVAGAAAAPVALVLDGLAQRWGARSRALRNAWAEHGRDDRYLSLREVRRVRDDWLPGARVRRHLLWRYSIVWTKLEEL